MKPRLTNAQKALFKKVVNETPDLYPPIPMSPQKDALRAYISQNKSLTRKVKK